MQLEVRAEVILLTRNIKIQGIPSPPGISHACRALLAPSSSATNLTISGVEFAACGQEGGVPALQVSKSVMSERMH